MESAARRRMESIGRHLLPPRILCRDLHLVPSLFACTRMLLFVLVQNPVSLTESNAIGSSPVIIGGMILDIHAKPFTDPVPGTTNPGEVLFRISETDTKLYLNVLKTKETLTFAAVKADFKRVGIRNSSVVVNLVMELCS
ncbi:hypothetical protein BHM03_00057324 [Ensete ventricosum]|nr:hypothetical protein BHM03_00057324 [Ensete ventricosum]